MSAFTAAVGNMLYRAAQRINPQRYPRHSWYSVPGKHAGIRITQETAMQLSAVYRAVSYISSTIMTLPWNVHRSVADGSSEHVRNRLDFVLHDQANMEQSAAVWRETMLSYALRWGNGFAEIRRNNRGEVEWLGQPIHPEYVRIERDENYQLSYLVTTDSQSRVRLMPNQIYHLKGLGDGISGESVVRHAARSMGVAAAQEQNVSSFFGNGSRTSGVLSHPGQIGPEGRENLTKYLEKRMQGPYDSHKLLVLEEGMEWRQMGMSNEDAEMLSSRQFSVVEIARWFGLPPHILMDYGRATWGNLEQASTEAVRSGLMPWVVRLEAEANAKLIGRNSRSSLSTSINLKGLLRADTDTRNRAYALGRQWGWMSVNDIRKLEDMPPIEGGDEYLTPLNMEPANGENTNSQNTPSDGREEVLNMPQGSIAILVKDVCDRVVTRELNQLDQFAKRDDFLDWFNRWIDKHQSYAYDSFKPVVEAINIGRPRERQMSAAELAKDYCDGLRDSVPAAYLDKTISRYVENKTIWIDSMTEEWMLKMEGE